MSVPVMCCPNPDCDASFRIAPEQAGKRACCKKCGTRFRLGEESNGQAHDWSPPTSSMIPADDPSPNLEPPNPFGRYQILGRVGHGGMGAVYLAHDTKLDRKVALKVPGFGVGEGTELIERFYREARAAAGLDHENLCRVFDVGQIDGIHFLTMAFVEGRTLAGVLRERGGSLDEEEAARIVRTLAEALAASHAGGVVHRDLKPGNIMVNDAGKLVVVDFGLAKRTDAEGDRLTRTGAVMGTPAYMSPEQVRGDVEAIGPASDVYSLGAILYELLTGRPPYVGSATLILGQLLTEDPPRPSKLRPGLDRSLEAIVLKAITRPIGERYDSMIAFAGALGSHLDRRAAAEATTRERTARPPGGPPRRLALVAFGAFLVATGIVIWIATDRGKVKLDIRDPDSVAAVLLDGREIKLQGLGEPVTVRAGEHDLKVTRRDLEVQTRHFAIRRGGEEVVTVDYVPGAAPAPTEITNSVGMTLRLIEPGEFWMGSDGSDEDADDDEKPRHQVRITKPFYLGTTEVTVGQFRYFVDATRYRTDAERGKGGHGWNEHAGEPQGLNPRYDWKNPGFPQTDEHPVVNVSWNDAVAYCEWLSRKEGTTYRLPTEAEWEYACRAGTTTKYACGDDPEALAEMANVADGTAKAKYPDWETIAAEDGSVFTAPVGHYRANAWGLHDLHGNVWEWCSDGYDGQSYRQSPVEDPAGSYGAALRVIRGGSWFLRLRSVRSADRIGFTPVHRNIILGFRVARVPTR